MISHGTDSVLGYTQMPPRLSPRLSEPNMSCSPYGLHLQKYKKISIIKRNKLILTLLYSSSMPFREWKEHHTCFYDACFPCAWCAGGTGNERYRKGCVIIKVLTSSMFLPLDRAQTSFLRPFGSKRQSRVGSVLAYSKHSSIHLFN